MPRDNLEACLYTRERKRRRRTRKKRRRRRKRMRRRGGFICYRTGERFAEARTLFEALARRRRRRRGFLATTKPRLRSACEGLAPADLKQVFISS